MTLTKFVVQHEGLGQAALPSPGAGLTIGESRKQDDMNEAADPGDCVRQPACAPGMKDIPALFFSSPKEINEYTVARNSTDQRLAATKSCMNRTLQHVPGDPNPMGATSNGRKRVYPCQLPSRTRERADAFPPDSSEKSTFRRTGLGMSGKFPNDALAKTDDESWAVTLMKTHVLQTAYSEANHPPLDDTSSHRPSGFIILR